MSIVVLKVHLAGYVNGETSFKSFSSAQHILIHKLSPKHEGNYFPYGVKRGEDMERFVKFMFGTAMGYWLS